MNTETVSGKFLAADAVDTHVECGFLPDHILAISDPAGTPVQHQFYKILYDIAASGRWGFIYAAAAAPTPNASAAAGIIPYDTSVVSVLLPAPDGDGFLKAASIADFVAATATYTARTITALGSVVRPTVHNGLVYEQTTHVGAGAEPTWPTKVGDSVTIVGGDTWICRDERIIRTGVKGFTIGETLSVAGIMWVFKAEKHSRYTYLGDARLENPVTFGDHIH